MKKYSLFHFLALFATITMIFAAHAADKPQESPLEPLEQLRNVVMRWFQKMPPSSNVFESAKRFDVSPEDLAKTFGQGNLKKALNSITLKLPLVSDKDPHVVVEDFCLEGLYPLFKLNLAAFPGWKNYSSFDLEEMIYELGDDVGRVDMLELGHRRFILRSLRLTIQATVDRPDSLNRLSLLSLRPKTTPGYYDDLFCLFNGLRYHTDFSFNPNNDIEPVGVIAKELLCAGQYVVLVNNGYCADNLPKKFLATEIIRWCFHNTKEFDFTHVLIADARALGLGEEGRIKKHEDRVGLRVFALKLYENWASLTQDTKKAALGLFVSIGLSDQFREHFPAMAKDFVTVKESNYECFIEFCEAAKIEGAFNHRFIQDLLDHHYQTEATQLIQKSLDSDTFVYLFPPSGVPLFLPIALQLDRKTTIAALKVAINEVFASEEAELLSVLSEIAPKAKRKYILERVQIMQAEREFHGELNSDGYCDLAKIYYHLGCKALLSVQLRKAFITFKEEEFDIAGLNLLNLMKSRGIPVAPYKHQNLLSLMRSYGIPVTTYQQLLDYDAFELMKTLEKARQS